jgi:hypothetical protein
MIYVSAQNPGSHDSRSPDLPVKSRKSRDIAGGAVEAASWPTVVTDGLAGRGLNRAYPLESTWT